MADSSAIPAFVAADMLSQAEHGRDSQAMLVCSSVEIAERVKTEIARQMQLLHRPDALEHSLSHSRLLVFNDTQTMIDFANAYAAEHLIISMERPWEVAQEITAAGSVFIGNYSPESAGDYASGTNHTLPTSGWARSFSGVNLDSFQRKITYQELTAEGLKGLSETLQYVRPNILALAPYSTARDDYQGGDISVWLDANESPYENGVNRYPDPHQKALKALISEIKGIGVEQIFVGNGSDEAIDLCFRIFCRPGIDNAVAITPSYGMYEVAAATNDVALRQVALNTDDFSLPTERLLAACDEHTKLLWICSPNNPTGNAFLLSQLEELAERFNGMLVVDEASLLATMDRHENLIILQTLSKAWGMAGLRLGLAFAHQEVAALFARVKYPYNVNGPTQRAVMERLRAGVDAQIAEIRSERERLAKVLPTIGIVERVFPSDANFFLIKTPDATRVYEALVRQGIIVRNRNSMTGCQGCLRITIGTPEENNRLINTLKSITHEI